MLLFFSKSFQGSINWRPIGSPFEHLTLNASMLSIHLQELKVGISTASSGITWASCLYLKTTGRLIDLQWDFLTLNPFPNDKF